MANVVEVMIRGIDEATRVFETVGKTAEDSMKNAEQSVNSVDDSIKSVSDLDVSTAEAESALNNAEQSADDVDQSVSNISDLDIDTSGADASLENVNDSLGEATDSAKSFGEKMSDAFQKVQDKWLEVTAVAGTTGLAFETMGSKQKDLTEQTERVARAMGTTQDEIRDSALEITNVTFPIEDVLDLMETGRQQGIESTEQLKEYASFWDTVGDATGLAGPELGKASTGLRAVGIAAGDEKEALAAFGYITENTSGQVDDFLHFLDRAGPQLNEMGMNVDDAAAVLGILEHEFGMSGRTARQEFRKAVNEADGDMNVLMETLGVSDDVFEQYRDTVADSSDVIQRNADIHADSYTAMDKLKQISSEIMYQYGDMIGVLSSLAPILMALGPLIKGVSMATKLFNMTLFASPITWIIAGIVALIAVIALLWTHWDEVSQFLSESWEWIKEVAEVVFNAIGEAISIAWEWIKETTISIWSGIQEFFVGTWEYIKEIFMSGLKAINNGLSVVWEFITDTIKTVWNGIQDFFIGIWDFIKNVFESSVETLKNVLSSAWEFITDTVETVWNAIKDFFGTIWEGIVSVVESHINSLKSFIDTVFNTIENIISKIWNTVKNVSTTVWNGIVSVVTGIINGFKNAISTSFNFIKNTISKIWNGIKNISSSIWDGIVSVVTRIINGLKNSISRIFNTIKDTVIGVWNGIKDSTGRIWDSMVGLVKAPINMIIGAINGMINGLNSLKIKSPKIPDWVPKFGGKSFEIGFNIPNIPMLASGGMAVDETLAIIGEGIDDEAVLPLNDSVMSMLGSMIAKHMNPSSANVSTNDINIKNNIDNNIDYKKLAQVIVDAMKKTLLPKLDGLSEGDIRLIIQNMNIRDDYDIYKLSRELQKLIDRKREGKGKGLT